MQLMTAAFQAYASIVCTTERSDCREIEVFIVCSSILLCLLCEDASKDATRHACELPLARCLYSGRSPSNLECESRALPCRGGKPLACTGGCFSQSCRKAFPKQGPASIITSATSTNTSKERMPAALAECRLFYIVPRILNASGCYQTNNLVTLRCTLRHLLVLLRRMKARVSKDDKHHVAFCDVVELSLLLLGLAACGIVSSRQRHELKLPMHRGDEQDASCDSQRISSLPTSLHFVK